MKQFKSNQLLTVVVISIFVHISSAMECQEVFQRRDEIKDCCSAPAVINKDELQGCMDSVEGNHHDKFFCGSECLLKGQNLMSGDQPDIDAIKQNADGFEGDWKETVQQIVDDCGQKMNNANAGMEQRGGPKGQCKPLAGILMMCLGREYIQHCPAEHWHESELCSKVKSGECDKKPKH